MQTCAIVRLLRLAQVSCHPVATASPANPAKTKRTRPISRARSRQRRDDVAALGTRGGCNELLIAIGSQLATEWGNNMLLFRFYEQYLRPICASTVQRQSRKFRLIPKRCKRDYTTVASVAARISSRVTSGAVSKMCSPLWPTSSTPRLVMMRSTTPLPVSGSVHSLSNLLSPCLLV